MPALIIIPLALLVLLMFSTGAALTSQNQAQAHGSFWTDFLKLTLGPLIWTAEQSVKLAKYLAHFMYPALRSAERSVAGWFAANGTITFWQGNHAHRTAHAVLNVADWANKDLRREIVEKAHAESSATFTKNAYTKAPPLPQRRLTQKEVDAEFQKLIEANFVKQLNEHYPKHDWDPSKWRKYLGILPALGSAVVHPKPTTPRVVPRPQPKPGTGGVPIAPAQPTTLPHTDDHPNPDPGTQTVPGVVSGKDKWARGQIVKLRKIENNTRRHLGPLAFLGLPLAAITTLIGLLECKNFGKFQRGICAIPGNIFKDLLNLLLDVFILADICEVMTLVQDGFGVVEGPLTDFIGGVGGALCHGDYDPPPAMAVPQLYLWSPAQIAA